MGWQERLRRVWKSLSGGPRVAPWPAERPASAPTPPENDAGESEFEGTYLRRLQTLTKSWAGDPLGPHGLLRAFNRDGSKPPLFWCFNAVGEILPLANGLGPDQPMVAMRSLNKVAPPGPGRRELVWRLADHYARTAMAEIDFERCTVGGNCQSGAIATRMALVLLRAGKQVDLLLTLDATPPEPYPGRVAMLFGQENEGHNPFFHAERPQDVWLASHGAASWTIVPGSYGQSFVEPNIGPLCAAIQDHLSVAPAPIPAESPARLTVTRRPAPTPVASELVVPVKIRVPRGTDDRGFSVLALWWSESLGAWPTVGSADKALVHVGTAGATRLVLPTPETPGPWQLRLVLCQEGRGPLRWRQDDDPVLTVNLESAEVAA